MLRFALQSEAKTPPSSLLFMLKIAFSSWVGCLLCGRQLRFLVSLLFLDCLFGDKC